MPQYYKKNKKLPSVSDFRKEKRAKKSKFMPDKPRWIKKKKAPA